MENDMSREFIDMNEIIPGHNILFICLDALRYDVAVREQERGTTRVLNRYGAWRRCQAAGNFTYPSHQAMFAGFLPIDEEIRDMKKRETLFFAENIGMGRKAPEGSFVFKEATWIEELAVIGYETYCVGGVGFFDKRTAIGKVLPGYFKYSYWNPSFGCLAPDSAANQVDFILRKLENADREKKIMMYLNISALHYPCNYYIPGEKKDSVETQAAALRYVDGEFERLFDGFKKQGETFVICLSDHGTCYGEDGVLYHGVNHPIVNTVPYKHFLL